METKLAIPTIQDLVSEDEANLKSNALMVILNQEPPAQWLKYHPYAKIKDKDNKDVPLPYLPIERIEYLLSRIYTKWRVEIRNVACIANSTVVTVRLYVTNPITGDIEWNDGVGAAPIQTDKGAGAMDWNAAKSNGVQISAPAAETYAIKDAAEKFGKLFGKDLSRKEAISYDSLLKVKEEITVDDLNQLYEKKKESLSEAERKDAKRVIDENEVKSFRKLKDFLANK